VKTLIGNDKATVKRLAERLKQAGSHREYQRIQCVLLRATLGSSAQEIAQILGWSASTVHTIHSRWAKEGEAIFALNERGGRHHQYLSEEEEKALLEPFVRQAEMGGMLRALDIRQAYAARVGKPVALSTIYRLLERHGWRKVIPRPRHPKADVSAQAAYKKTAALRSRRGRASG